MLVVMLNMSEAWMPFYDVWAADQVCVGLMVATAPFWARHKAAAGFAVVFGTARAGCTAVWPNASDTGGSICDMQSGLPLTVGVLALALQALERMRHREREKNE